MKIGILTLFHGNDNWGGVLQGLAMKKILEDEYPSAVVDIIDYRSKNNVVYPNQFSQARQYSLKEILKKGEETIFRKKHPLGNRLSGRTKLFHEFRSRYLTNMHIYTDGDLSKLSEDYDCLICGSDQIWNPNVAKPGFFLKGINGDCRKVSYAASIARDFLSEREMNVMAPLINQFDAVSVREKTAKDILEADKSKVEKPVYEVLDPTLMVSATTWLDILKKHGYCQPQDNKKQQERQKLKIMEAFSESWGAKSKSGTKPYALAFFFSNSLPYRKEIGQYCFANGWKLKFIPFAAKYIADDEKGECERLYDVGPAEFLGLCANAEYIFTDSFHGSVFSIIFRKEFLVFERDASTKVSKNSRLYDLLKKFNLSDRLVKDNRIFRDIVNEKIRYDDVYELLEKYQKESIDFLREAIGLEKSYPNTETVKRVDEMEAERCCGCGLCATVCPQNCISYNEDIEGFWYPYIGEECISCGRCLKVCESKNHIPSDTAGSFKEADGYMAFEMSENHIPDTYVGFNNDDRNRSISSSGGIFCELAKSILRDGGTVYGAVFSNSFSVKHVRIDEEKNLGKLLTSKYVQSDCASVFTQIESDLNSGRKVLFAGTPCQTASVKAFAVKNHIIENLFLVDFVCHGVPSPGVWRSYLKRISGNLKIHEVAFRDKSYAGWHNYYLHIEYGDNSHGGFSSEGILNESHETNAYMRAFLNDWDIRPSCYRCCFKENNYAGDITLGDAWKIEMDCPDWDDDKGVSLFMIRTSKGRKVMKSIDDNIQFIATDYHRWTRYNPSIVKATGYNLLRPDIFRKFSEQETDSFWKEQSVMPYKKRVKYLAKMCLKRTGLDRMARKRLK